MIVYAFDNQHDLNALESALKQIENNLDFKGYTETAQILKHAEQHNYDIIFADLEFQNRNGMLLLGQLHWMHPYSNLIGVSSRENEGDALTLHKLHASDYLIKPYDAVRLADSLRHLRFPLKNHYGQSTAINHFVWNDTRT